MSETLDNRDTEPVPETPQSREIPQGTETSQTPETPQSPGRELHAADGAGVPAASEALAAAPAKKRRPRVAAVAGVGVLLAAVVGGVGFTVVTVQGADRDPGRPVWHLPKGKGAEAKTPAPTGLAAALVPYDVEWTRGPDLAQFGSDAQLSGAEATALTKESFSDLPRTQRKRVERLVDEQHIKGMAMRSYLLDNTGTSDGHSVTVSIVLSQLGNRTALKDASTFQSRFLDALGVFRKGPAVKGHKNAACFLPPKDTGEKIDAMMCSAYQGDVLVTLDASGPKDLATGDLAKLMETQLDRIKEPGKSV